MNRTTKLLILACLPLFDGCADQVEPLVKGNVIAERAIHQIRADDQAIVNGYADKLLRESRQHAAAVLRYELQKIATVNGGSVPLADVERLQAGHDASVARATAQIEQERDSLLQMGNIDILQRLLEAQGRGLRDLSSTARDIDEILTQLGMMQPRPAPQPDPPPILPGELP